MVVVQGTRARPSTVTPPVRPAPAQTAAPTATTATPTSATGTPGSGAGTGSGEGPPLQQVPGVGKTGTPIVDLPFSVQIIPSTVVEQQGGTSLRQAVRNASGISEGGPSSYGFFDRFLIRGMDARIYSDGFSDGDQINGYPHSLNGVSFIEVLKGPGSALFGSGPPGGTINMIHYLPSPIPAYGFGVQAGSFASYTTTAYATGPTIVPGLNYRVDALAQHADNFRHLPSANYEFRPAWTWTPPQHVTNFSIDARHIERTPDAYGLIFFRGLPIGIDRETKYSTPFSFGNQDLARTTITDAWSPTDFVTVNNRVSYLHRDLELLRNSGGTVSGLSFVSRQLRHQHDMDDDIIYQFEPLWKFRTGFSAHSLLTGFEARQQFITANRATADLPNISNIFGPVIPEASAASLNFLRDAAHAGFIDKLSARYLSLYVIDQIDVTDQLKVRLSGRKDWWDTSLTPQVFVPGRVFDNGQLFQPGVTYKRHDEPLSWAAGAVYKIMPGVAPFVGIARSNLANFNSEATANGIHDPESALQRELGVKLSLLQDRLTFTAAAFDVKRTNVFAQVTVAGVTTGVFNDQLTKGYELDLVFQVTPKLKVIANATFQHAELTANPSQPAATGKQPIGVPSHIYNAWVTYDFAIGPLDGFRIAGGMSYRDIIYADALNTLLIPHYTIYDLVLSYNKPKWDLSVGIKNLTDVTYFSTALGSGASVGEPRTFFAKANLRW